MGQARCVLGGILNAHFTDGETDSQEGTGYAVTQLTGGRAPNQTSPWSSTTNPPLTSCLHEPLLLCENTLLPHFSVTLTLLALFS